jgi:hypothetical protein
MSLFATQDYGRLNDHRRVFTPADLAPTQVSLRKERDKRCTICGAPGAVAMRRMKHLVQAREKRRILEGWKKRYRASLSYRLQRVG